MKRTASALLVGVACLAGCDEADRFSRVQLDTSPNCVAATVDVLIPDLDRPEQPWSRVIAVAMDEAGALRFWALVQESDNAGLAMVYVSDGAVTLTVPVSGFLPEATDVSLVAGPTSGSAWITETGPGTMRLWQFDANVPEAPLRAISPNLGWFPGSLAELCLPESGGTGFDQEYVPCEVGDWPRELAFVEGQPFLISTAPFSPNATMFVYAGRLRPDLGITEQTQLEFFRRCDGDSDTPGGSACAQEIAETTYPSLAVMGSQQDTSSVVHHQFIVRERSRDRVPVAREAVALALDLDENDNLRGFVFSRALDEVGLAAGPPGGLATDDLAAYLLHPVEEGGARVTRLRTTGAGAGVSQDRFEVLEELQFTDNLDSLQMLQLPGDIAVGALEDGVWAITKLFPDAPERSAVTRYAPDAPVTAIRSAGRGAYLVFKDHALGPDLVQLRCADED